MCVCVRACGKPSSTVWWCCLTGRLCRLTSALGQRAKVISLSQPKVSGKARNPPRGTVGPAHSPSLHSCLNQSDLFPSSVSVFAVGPDSVLCLRTNGLLFLLVSIRELLCVHAAAAALTSCLLFPRLILLLSVECRQQPESTHHNVAAIEPL